MRAIPWGALRTGAPAVRVAPAARPLELMAAVLLWTSALHLRQTVLHVAARKGHAALVELLLSHDAGVHAVERLFGCHPAVSRTHALYGAIIMCL